MWLLETFVDPRYFHGTIYRAANWEYVGETRGFRRTRSGYSATAQTPKRVFVRPLVARARPRLSQPRLDPADCHGAPKMMLSAEHMCSLPAFFAAIPDPRRAQGRRHPLPTVLAIATAAVLCGARGYKAIAQWAEDLGQKARARFRCRYRNGRYEVPSRTRIRDVLIRVDPLLLDRALQGWNAQYAEDRRGPGHRRQDDVQRHRRGGSSDPYPRRRWPSNPHLPHPKKVAGLPVDGTDEVKQTNEIGMAIPLLEGLDIAGKTVTADALLTQRNLARYLVEERDAHYLFTAKDNQPTLLADIRLFFENRGEPDFREPLTLEHGRLESRAIWTTTRLNDYLNFPFVGQAFAIERLRIEKKTGEASTELVYGLTDHTPQSADPARLLAFNRDHWGVEAHHYMLDWNWDEDRCTLRTGHGPENITRLRRFATGLIKSKSRDSVAATIDKLARNVRRVFDYLRMTGNSTPTSQPSPSQAR